MHSASGPRGLLCLVLCTAPAIAPASPVFINEFHYDNAGADNGEFIEVAGPAGTDLGGWRLVLYNGLDGGAYGDIALSGVLGDATGSGFGFHVIDLPSNGLQNGAADGIALLDAAGMLREFLSYEGTLIASDGPALGLTSLDVGVGESGTTPVGASLQRVGAGTLAGDFVWQALATATPGSLNLGQVLTPAGAALPLGAAWPLWLAGLAWLARRRGYSPKS